MSICPFREDRNVRLSLLAAAFALVCGCEGVLSGLEEGVEQPDASEDAGLKVVPECPESPEFMADCDGSECAVPWGCFTMGSPAEENCREAREPQREVVLTRGFEISATEVTQAQFEAVMGYNPSQFTTCGGDCPVESVSWHEAAAYCNALSTTAGLEVCYECRGEQRTMACRVTVALLGAAEGAYACGGYRLPTEAEWEYAARAGATIASHSGELSECHQSDPTADQMAWYGANAGATTHPVGEKPLNAWGLADVTGNVAEWTTDWYGDPEPSVEALVDPTGAVSGIARVIRGGSYLSRPLEVRLSSRSQRASDSQTPDVGFRCVLNVDALSAP